MSDGPIPQRLSDADRDAAVAMLREHFEAGRLDEPEFTDRMQKALDARFPADLVPLFADLPDPRPPRGSGVQSWTPPVYPSTNGTPDWTPPGTVEPRPPSAPPVTPNPWIGTARGLIWPIAIALAFLTGNWWMWIVIAIVGSIVLQQIANQRKPPPSIGP